jgi:programmed cell death 6-interacting protein
MAPSNALFLPFRRTHPVSLSLAIKQYISSKYDQHPDMFTGDLNAIDQIRNDAINVREPHISGVRKLLAYAAQLVWMSGKFPIDVSVHYIPLEGLVQPLDGFAEGSYCD